MDRYGMRMAGMLMAATVHRWLGGAGIPRRLHFPTLIASIAVIDAASTYFTVELHTTLGPIAQFMAVSPYRQPALEYLLLGVSAAATLLVVFGESAATQATQLIASVRALPVSSSFLSVARSLPTALTLLVLAISAAPPTVALVVAFGWLDIPRASLGVAAAIATGAAEGLAVVAGVRALKLGRRHLPPTSRYPLAVCIWAGATALQVEWVRVAPGPAIAGVDWALVWPAAAKGIAMASTAACTASALIAVAYLIFGAILYIASPEPETGALLRRMRLRWSANGSVPLLRMEVLRLWRAGRIRSVAAVNLILGVLGVAAITSAPAGSRDSFALLVIMVLAVLWMAIPLMARGVGTWHSPVQLQLGASPVRWALAVTAASWLFAAAVAAPSLVLLAVTVGDARVLVTGAFLTAFAFAVASLIGFSVPAGGENTVGEVSGMVAGGMAVLVAVWGAGQVIHSAVTSAVVVGVIGLCIAPLTGLIESARWRTDTRSSRA
jgi:hypothetical protein